MNVSGINKMLKSVSEAMWSADVQTKWHPPEGFFGQSASKIASGLKQASKDLKQAMSRLNFYINRAGGKLGDEDVKKLDVAKKKLQSLYAESSGEGLRSRGGKWVKEVKKLPKYKGKEISFAELDGPFSTGPGGKGDLEQGEYVIVFYDKNDNEIGDISYKDAKGARDYLKKLASQGVEVSSLTGDR